jgi:hypothetical protein
MNTKLSPARMDESSAQLRYVLVNHRTPRANLHCRLCGGELEEGYVRDLQTEQLYRPDGAIREADITRIKRALWSASISLGTGLVVVYCNGCQSTWE